MYRWYEGTGKVVYEPYRGKMSSRNWCVIEVDKEITRFARWFIEREWYNHQRGPTYRKIEVPSWDAHISIVRGERIAQPYFKEEWRKYDGRTVSFRWNNRIRQTNRSADGQDHYWFVDVDCPEVNFIRRGLGLPVASPDGKLYSAHLSIARTYDI